MPNLTRTVEGLQVPISPSGYRKERATLDGLFYWDRESQDIILAHLGDFLPKVRETPNAGVFSLVIDGKENCGPSAPLRKTKLPTETFTRVEESLEHLRSHLDRGDLTPEARLIIEKFALPDPDRLPEFYRTYSRKKEPQLLIIWGCNLSKSDFIAPAEALAKLGHESGLSRFLRKALPYILGLLLLALIAFFIWLYLCLPVVDLKLSKERAGPHEPIRAFVTSEKGDSFLFEADSASLTDSQPDNRVVGNSIPEWKKGDPVTTVDLNFPESGNYDVKVTGKGQLFGLPLPSVSVKKKVSIVAGEKAPTVSQPNIPAVDASILASAHVVTIRLVTQPGELPAKVSVTATAPGSLQMAGSETEITQPGVPVGLPPLTKPGVYRAKYTGENGTEEQHFVKISPNGGSPLVANIRPNKAEVSVHENFLLDASASMEQDPEARISSKEISLDGGKTFTPMEGDYHVASFSEPGDKEVVLKVRDDKGREQTDITSVKVVASEPPKPTQMTSGTVSRQDLASGAVYSIPEEILFDPGQAEISEQGERLLNEFAKSVAGENVIISVVGHTDDVPISQALRARFADNQQLSEARAQSAIDVLAADGVKKENLRSVGKGDSVPLVPNTSTAQRAKNRRIEVAIIPTGN